MKALVVEDLLPAFIAAKAILSQYGFEVDKAVDGVEGTEKATNNNYTLILMDIGLPKMNGIEATKAIREAGVDTPIFALSANLGEHKRETLIDAGMQAGYEKPLTAYKISDLFYRCQFTPAKDFEKLLTQLPGLDSREDSFDCWGEPFDNLEDNRQKHADSIAAFTEKLQTAYEAKSWDDLQNDAASLRDIARDSGALRLALSCAWLEQQLAKPQCDEMTSLFYKLATQSLALYITDYREEYID